MGKLWNPSLNLLGANSSTLLSRLGRMHCMKNANNKNHKNSIDIYILHSTSIELHIGIKFKLKIYFFLFDMMWGIGLGVMGKWILTTRDNGQLFCFLFGGTMFFDMKRQYFLI
jgi:hypothetical protein